MRSSHATTTNTTPAALSWPLRVLLMLAVAFVFGLLAALVKGQDGDGISAISQVRSHVGNLSAPWLMVAYISGSRSKRPAWGALMGLFATMSALLGFYLLTSLVLAEPLGGQGILDNLGRELRANRIWLASGLLSGPLFGALGARWRAVRWLNAGVVTGALMAGEPVLLAAMAAVRPVMAVGESPISVALDAAELALGLVVLLVALLRRRVPGVHEATARP